jgi:hypothetical protein
MSDAVADTVSTDAPAAPVVTPVESAAAAPVVETPAAASPPVPETQTPATPAPEVPHPVTDKLPEQFSATPPHSQAAPALRQGPNPVSPEIPPVQTPTPEIPQPSPAPQPLPPTNPVAAITIKDRLYAALEKIQFRKRAKLNKILILAAKKRSIKNDDVEKLLKVSDSTAQRYLKQLVQEGRLKVTQAANDAFYEPV